MNTTKIVKEVSRENFKNILEKYSSRIKTSPHALDHLSLAQREVFNEEALKKILLEETPKGIGKQRNGRFAVFFKRKEGFMKIICEIKRNKLEIITFINTDKMPNMKRLK